jgi:hypothetical protein
LQVLLLRDQSLLEQLLLGLDTLGEYAGALLHALS